MNASQLVERKLRELLGLRERCGALAVLERELERLHEEHGLDAREVAARLDGEPWLVRRLGGAMTIDESFFMRHPEHFDVLRAELPTLLRQPHAPPVLWSAGCANGEEPFSMAIALCGAGGPDILQRVRIVANDISEGALQVARHGVYGDWSFRGAKETFRARYFQKRERAPGHRLIAPIHEAVQFRHLPIESQLAEFQPASIDVIFCRNVALYLTDAALTRVYGGFVRVLKPGGILLLGPADPLPSTSALHRVRTLNTLVHRKPVQRQDSAPLAPRPASRPQEPPELSQAERLADRGLTGEALSLMDAQIELLGRSAERLGIRGRIRLAAGDAPGGVVDLREALALDPDQLVLRFHYALGLEADQQTAGCRSELQGLLHALAARSDADTLGEGAGATTVGSLRRAAQELLRRME